MTFKNALWVAGFPEIESEIISGVTDGAGYVVVQSTLNRLQRGSIEIDEHGAGGLRVTAKTDIDALRAVVTLATDSTAAVAFADGVLTLSNPSTGNLGAIKDLIDGLAGAPFTTAFFGTAGMNDALNAGVYNYSFETNPERRSIIAEVRVSQQAWMHRGLTAPSDDTTSIILDPGEATRCEVTAGQRDMRIKRLTGTNANFSVRVWARPYGPDEF